MTELAFGEWLKRQRMGRGLTREQLAHQIGCAVVTLRKIEAEERRPSPQIVERLAEILEISKSERINFLKYARGDWSQARGENIQETPWQASTSPRTNLPAPLTSFIGRAKEQKEVIELIGKNRLVTLIGPPGIGKTRLSIEAARQLLADFPDGIFFVELAPLDEPSLIAPTTLQALGYVESKKLSADKQLMQGIGDKRILIVLDNCEHLIQDAAAFASQLLSACPYLKILATSRESVRVTGEWLFAVPMLPVPEADSSIPVENVPEFAAVVLFAERARAVHSNFTLDTNNLQSVVSICARLDGLPLAIELIAAQMRLHSAQSLLERLNDQFILSTEGVRDAPSRQISLRYAIGWSYKSLTPDEQRLFANLSVFSGGFTLSAVEGIFSSYFAEISISALITSLLDKNLLQRSTNSPGEVRLTMLVTIQQFALDCLQQLGDETEVRNWHLSYFLDLAERADQQIHGPAQGAWMDRLDMELDNFRTALNWSLAGQQTEKILRLLAALGWNWLVRWSPSEYRNWLDHIRTLPELDNHPETYAQILNTAVHQEWVAGNFSDARAFVEESKEIWQELGTTGERGLAEALYLSGMIPLMEGNYVEAASYFEQSLGLYQKCGDRWGMAMAKFLLGNVTLWNEEEASTLRWLTQSFDLFDELGDPWGIARVSQRLGELFLKQGSYEKAQVHFDRHLRLDEGLHFKQGTVVALYNLGNLFRHQGDYGQAKRYYEKSLSMCREFGLKIDRGINLFSLGMLALHQNDYPQAMRYFIDYFATTRRSLEKPGLGDLLTGLAAIAAGTNQPERAAKLHGAAQALFETTDYRIPPFDRAEFDRHIQMAEKQLGGAKFEELMSEGFAMTMEQAIAYALENEE